VLPVINTVTIYSLTKARQNSRQNQISNPSKQKSQ